jgi:hypothetical protein
MKGGISTLLALTHALGGFDSIPDINYPSSKKGTNPLKPEDIKLNTKRIIPKGCQVYNINGEEIVAISEKSAIKKYNKKFGKIK